jgi:hypothetical protein
MDRIGEVLHVGHYPAQHFTFGLQPLLCHLFAE